MGDQVGAGVFGSLYYVPLEEFQRIKALKISATLKAKLFACLCRINTLYMIARAGSGHIGSSFSSMDIMVWIQLNELDNLEENKSIAAEKNIFFSSKGHDSPALYSTLIGVEKLDFDLIHKLRKLNGLPGHPDIITPHIITNTGSLGMGVSKAKGILLADRLNGKSRTIYVLTGDGELQEGQFWESLVSATNQKMEELTVIIDHNKLQSDTLVSKVNDLGNLHEKLSAFGWYVGECNGNNMDDLALELNRMKALNGKPKIIIANTIKGKGVSFMEHTSIDSDVENYKFHSGAPSYEIYIKAIQELVNEFNKQSSENELPKVTLKKILNDDSSKKNNGAIQKLIPAYSDALINIARKNNKIIALDADLLLDTGLIRFQKEFEERFVECGIAEQDMVSQAGGLALQGMLPIVHSFSCFLSARSREQIYNNATENKKIIYVGSLAGLLPAGPGHSHQSITDIATLSAIPNLAIIEPFIKSHIEFLLKWAIENRNKNQVYIRISSIPTELPDDERKFELKPYCGTIIFESNEHYIICHGPWLYAECYAAVKKKRSQGENVGLIVMSWLNNIDTNWAQTTFKNIKRFDIYQDHSNKGGIADMLAREILSIKINGKISYNVHAVNGVPASGNNQEIMKLYSFDRDSIYRNI
jgi:transketolase